MEVGVGVGVGVRATTLKSLGREIEFEDQHPVFLPTKKSITRPRPPPPTAPPHLSIREGTLLRSSHSIRAQAFVTVPLLREPFLGQWPLKDGAWGLHGASLVYEKGRRSTYCWLLMYRVYHPLVTGGPGQAFQDGAKSP